MWGKSSLVNDDHPLAPLIRRWSKHGDLSAEDREAVAALPYTRKAFGKDAYIVREGQKTTDCSVLLRGFAFRQKLLRNGSRQIISIHVPSEFIDLQNGILELADHSVQSVERTELAIIPRAAILEVSDARP